MPTVRRGTSPSHLSAPQKLSPVIAGDLNARHVTGHYELLDGTPIQGSIKFTANTVLLDQNSDLILMPESFTAVLDVNGEFDILLPVTNDPDITPTDWVYTVTETFTNALDRTPYTIQVPYDASAGADTPVSIWSLVTGTGVPQALQSPTSRPIAQTAAYSGIGTEDGELTVRRGTSASHLLGPVKLSPVITGDLNARHVTGHYELLDGTPVQGSIRFTATTVLVDEPSDLILMPETFVAVLDASGMFDILLPVTDDPDITPTGWGYTVTEQFSNATGRNPYSIAVPYEAGADVNLPIWSIMTAGGGGGTSGGVIVQDATTTAKGIIQLAGDLGGTADAPTVPGLATKADASALAAKADVSALAAKADLVGGIIPTAQLPALATGQTVTVADQAAMLALTAAQVQPGDVAIRTDQSGHRWLLAAADPSVLGNWIPLEVPDAVTSVNGLSGAVNLAPTDVGAQPVDPDLTTIAALDSATAGVMSTDGAGWIRKTYAQLKAALGLVKADVGLGNVDNTADAAKPVSTAQQTALDAKQPLAAPLTSIAGLALAGNAAKVLTVKPDASGYELDVPAAGGGSGAAVFHGVRLYNTADVSIANGGQVVPWNGETYDTDGFHDNVTNNTRVTIPAGMGGQYLIAGLVEFAFNATGNRSVAVYKNGVVAAWGTELAGANAGNFTVATSVTGVLDLVPGDYIELFAFHNSGVALNALHVGAGADTRLEVMYVGNGLGSVPGSTTPTKSVSLYPSASGNINNAAWTLIPFDGERWDTDGFHDNATNNTRITIPTGGDGKYLFNGSVDCGNNNVGQRSVAVYKNGALSGYLAYGVSAAQGEVVVTGSIVIDAVAGDYFELAVYQTSGGTIGYIGGSAANAGTRFSATRLGAGVAAPATLAVTSPSDVPLIIKGATGQTADLQQWQSGAGTVLSKVDSVGKFMAGTKPTVVLRPDNISDFYSANATTVALGVNGSAGQTADLQDWKDSANTVLTAMQANGAIYATNESAWGGAAWWGGGINVQPPASASNVGIVVRGRISQVGDLQQWQNSAGTILAKVPANGSIITPGGLFGGSGADPATTARNMLAGNGPTDIALVVRAAASQTANVQEWQDSAATKKVFISPSFEVNVTPTGATIVGSSAVGAMLGVQSRVTNQSTIVAKMIASQTANPIEVLDSAGTVKGGFDISGRLIVSDRSTAARSAGAAAALPNLPAGYAGIRGDTGTLYYVPYYT